VEVTASGLNMRVSPSGTATILGTLASGARVELVDDSNPSFYGIKLWVSKRFARKV
jgi:hypothetical protein